MSLIICSECGKEFSDNAQSCPNCGNPTKKITEVTIKDTVNVNIVKNNGTWSAAKLVIGIISMILFFIISFQSCAVGIGNSLLSNNSNSGSIGFMCALFMLIGGFISVATRNSNNTSGAISAIVFYWFATFFTILDYGIYKDLLIWGSVSFCFGAINLGSIFAKSDIFKEKKKQHLLITSVVILSTCYFVIALLCASEKISDNNSNKNYSTINNNSSSKKKVYGLNEPFIFDDLEITISNKISYVSVQNKYSKYYQKGVLKIPITVKNLKDTSHSLNMFYCNVFGSEGTRLDDIPLYFDDSIDQADSLRTGASYTKNMYILFDGNGKYSIEFNDWSNDKITIEFNVNVPEETIQNTNLSQNVMSEDLKYMRDIAERDAIDRFSFATAKVEIEQQDDNINNNINIDGVVGYSDSLE